MLEQTEVRRPSDMVWVQKKTDAHLQGKFLHSLKWKLMYACTHFSHTFKKFFDKRLIYANTILWFGNQDVNKKKISKILAFLKWV